MADARETERVFSGPLRGWPGLWCRLRGYTIEDASENLRALLGVGFAGADLRALLHAYDRDAFAQGRPSIEARARGADGRWHWLVWETVTRDGDSAVCFVHDASEQRRAEKRLSLQFAVARELAENGPLRHALPRILENVARAEGWRLGVLWTMGKDERTLSCDTFWSEQEKPILEFALECKALSFSKGQGLPGIVWQNDAPVWVEDMESAKLPRSVAAARAGLHCVCAFPLRRGPDMFGVIEFFSEERKPPDADAMEAVELVCVQLGQTLARRHAESALGHARSHLEYVVRSAPVVLFATDASGRIVLYDGGGTHSRREGAPTMVGRHVTEVFGARKSAVSAMSHAFARARAGESFTCMIDGEGNRRYETRWAPLLDDDGKRAGAIGVGLDVTDLEDAKVALRESEKLRMDAERMASLGTLAAGVAHEINNPLTYVNILLGRLVSLEQANARDDLGRHRLEMLDEVREGVGRVEEIVRALRTFSVSDDGTYGAADVHEALESALRMVGTEIRHRAELARDYAPIPMARGSAARLAQVFLNLLMNAAQSMPEGEAHTHQLRVRTRQREDGRISVEISDTGTGIPRELIGRIFEPFFTTKRVGQGSGLGLSICRGIVASMGGEITVESELGHGSRFQVIMPAFDARVVAPPGTRPPGTVFADGSGDGTPLIGAEVEPAQPHAHSGRARVLVVDDDRSVAKVVATVLGEHHEVTIARSGREALAALERVPDVDLIVCDLMMPEVSGIDLYETLVLVRPELADHFLFMTGGAFTPERLLGAVAEVLGATGGPARPEDEPIDDELRGGRRGRPEVTDPRPGRA